MNIDNSELVAGLVELAEFLKKHPQVIVQCPTFYIFPKTKEALLESVRGIGGAKKEISGNYFSFVKEFGPVHLHWVVDREVVCERVKVGEEVIPARPEMTLPATPETVSAIYEWRCPESVLGEA